MGQSERDALLLLLRKFRADRARIAARLETIERTIETLERAGGLIDDPEADEVLPGEHRGLELETFAAAQLEAFVAGAVAASLPTSAVAVRAVEHILSSTGLASASIQDLFDSFPPILRGRYNADRLAAIEALRLQIRKDHEDKSGGALEYNKGRVSLRFSGIPSLIASGDEETEAAM